MARTYDKSIVTMYTFTGVRFSSHPPKISQKTVNKFYCPLANVSCFSQIKHYRHCLRHLQTKDTLSGDNLFKSSGKQGLLALVLKRLIISRDSAAAEEPDEIVKRPITE